MGVSVCHYVHVRAGAPGSLEARGLRCFGPELQAIVSLFDMDGKIELRSSLRAVSTVNH